jgi:hypothetical protein
MTEGRAVVVADAAVRPTVSSDWFFGGDNS